MGLFWKRKKADQFVTLGLNEPAPKREEPPPTHQPVADTSAMRAREATPPPPELVPPISGASRTRAKTWSKPTHDGCRAGGFDS
jgi:hypothetical protein